MAITARATARKVRASLPEAGLVLASTGKPFSAAAIDLAAARARQAAEGRVRVVTVARIHGSAFGLQHPGLMPNKKEKEAAQQVVADAIRALQRKGLKADGEVVITRSPSRSFAAVARSARQVTHIVIDEQRGGWLGKAGVRLTGRSVLLRVKGAGVTVVSGGVVEGGS
jgi:nucleotide-binding universal stress UspA family protein